MSAQNARLETDAAGHTRATLTSRRADGTVTAFYVVDATDGILLGWHSYADEASSSVDSEPSTEALTRTATDLTRRIAGEAADALRWSPGHAVSSDRLALHGEAPPRGTPPRRGLDPRVDVEFARDGRLIGFLQIPADTNPEVEARVSEEEAIRIAADYWGIAEPELMPDDSGCYLYQRCGKLRWSFRLRDARQAHGVSADEATYPYTAVVNAVTGAVTFADTPLGSGGDGRVAPGLIRRLAHCAAVGLAALALLLAGAVVVRRRRRAA